MGLIKKADVLDFPRLNNRQELDKTLLFISSYNTPKSFQSICDHLFNNWKGYDLEQHTKGILLELLDDGFIEEEKIGSVLDFERIYAITGKGKKFCNRPIGWFRKTPYLYDRITKNAEKIITKYLPIIISLISLIIAILAYVRTSQPKV